MDNSTTLPDGYCFNMVQDFHKVSFYHSLEIINAHFQLDLLGGFDGVRKEDVKQSESLKKEKKKVFRDMPFKARMFNAQGDREFWSPYQITRSNLIEDEVFPILWYKIYSKKLKNHVVIRPQTRCYMVGNFDIRSKFYTPDKKGKGKWATNCSQNDIWGLDSLPLTGEQLSITKSYKDYRVLKNQGMNVIAFQNEGMTPDMEILKPLLGRFKEIIVFFDNDRAGIEAAESLVELINSIYPAKARHIYLNVVLLKEKISDPSDFIKSKGRQLLQKFLKRNKVKININ